MSSRAADTNTAATPGRSAAGLAAGRDVREIVRDEQIMRRRILEVLGDEARTIPQIAESLGRPPHEVTFWVMGLRKYGWLREEKEVTGDGYFQYRATEAAKQ